MAFLIAAFGPGITRVLGWLAAGLGALAAVWVVLRRERSAGASEERERRNDQVRDATARADRELAKHRPGDAAKRLRDGKF